MSENRYGKAFVVGVALGIVFVVLFMLAKLAQGASCEPPAFIDSHGHCFDFNIALEQWKHDHPIGIGPERLGKTSIQSLYTTGAAPCRFVGTRQWAQYQCTWGSSAHCVECVNRPQPYPPWQCPGPQCPYPPNGVPPDPDTVWGLHKSVVQPDGQHVTVNYLIACDAELFFGACAQDFSNRFNCQLDMGDAAQLTMFTDYVATEKYPTIGPSCAPPTLLVNGFETGMTPPWAVGVAPAPTPTPTPTPSPTPDPCPGQCLTMTGCAPC